MDKIISDIKFDNISQDYGNLFRDAMNNATKNDVSNEELIKSINELANKIKQYHPVRHDEGYHLYYYAVCRIKDLRSQITYPEFSNPILNWIKSIIESGWTATNGDFLMEAIYLLPEEYFSSMSTKQLEEHFAILDLTEFELSEYDIKDNESYVKDMQNRFIRAFFSDKVKVEDTIIQHLDLMKYIYMKFWLKNENSIKIYSNLLSSIKRKFQDIYLQNSDVFISHFQEINAKVITEEVPTEVGQKEVISFYTCNYSLLRKSKDIVEKIMDHWLCGLFSIYKVRRTWADEILETLAREIDLLDRSFEKTAFIKCDHLFNDAINMLASVVNEFPQSSDFPTNDNDYKKKIELFNRIFKSLSAVFFKYSMKSTDQFESFIPTLLRLIDLNADDTIGHYSNFFDNLKKSILVYVKAKPQLINPFIDQFIDTAIRFGANEDVTVEYPFDKERRKLENSYNTIKNLGKATRAFSSPVVQATLQKGMVKIFNNYSLSVSAFISNFCEFVVFKDYSPDDLVITIQSINKAVAMDIFHIYNPNIYSVSNFFAAIAEHICKSSTQYQSSFFEMAKTMRLLLKFDLQWDKDGELQDSPSNLSLMSIFGEILMTKSESSEPIEIFYPILIDVLDICDESSNLYSAYISYLFACPLTMSNPEKLAPNVGGLIHVGKKIINSDYRSNLSTMFMSLKSICTTDPSSLFPYMDDIEYLSDECSNDNSTSMQALPIFSLVYSANPEKIKESVLTKLNSKINSDLGNASQVMGLFNLVSKVNPKLVEPFLDDIYLCLKQHKLYVIGYVINILENILEKNHDAGEKMFETIVENIEENINDTTYSNISLNGLRSLGVLRHDLLVGLKDKIVLWQQAKPPLHDACQHLLDVIADRSLATLGEDLSQQKKVIDIVDTRLEKNEVKVEDIQKNVKAHEVAIVDVSQKVDDTNVKVEKLKTDVKIIDGQVQEIDLKTVSSAPKWAREVSKLLNPESDNDWRLLASRLGYSNDDVRAWATQADPCMSLLSEWFAVRRHIEATKSILEQLTEMNLVDAARIVENALTAAESVISDDDPIEFIEPPLIFLSYQWAVQEEVKVLRSHLQKAGYRCWMDIGQMGGGDKLYEAIDRGIRGAKVFISCVTDKYSQSPNCKRELNLSISLNKAVIPLQMERMNWPPSGTMGPLLTEYIFIRMFAKPGGKLVDGTFWPKERFQELLMQIRYSCAPDYDNIDGEYSGWWIPPGDNVKYVAKEGHIVDGIKDERLKTENGTSETDSPEIFLSYQWGKQEQVKKLYLFLTSKGLSCWMDIYQMGGGDSLYDKIDRGVRGCKVMISCVTSSYSQSPNCRREVSLCDNLKKPLIPILLEQITWPPEGPMSMTFTQLLFISFVDSLDEQNTWKGRATEELLSKIYQIITDKPSIGSVPSISSRNLKDKVIDNVEKVPKVGSGSTLTATVVPKKVKSPLKSGKMAQSKSCLLM